MAKILTEASATAPEKVATLHTMPGLRPGSVMHYVTYTQDGAEAGRSYARHADLGPDVLDGWRTALTGAGWTVVDATPPAALPLGEEAEPNDAWKASNNTVPIGGVSPKAIVIHSGWNGGHPVEIAEIEDSTRAHGVTFVAWRDVRKPEGRSTVVRVPSDMQVTPCTLNDTPTP